MSHYVYARRGGNPPRLLAGPFATRAQADNNVHRARTIAVANHYAQPREQFYAGPAAPGVTDPGIVNRLLGLPVRTVAA